MHPKDYTRYAAALSDMIEADGLGRCGVIIIAPDGWLSLPGSEETRGKHTDGIPAALAAHGNCLSFTHILFQQYPDGSVTLRSVAAASTSDADRLQ